MSDLCLNCSQDFGELKKYKLNSYLKVKLVKCKVREALSDLGILEADPGPKAGLCNTCYNILARLITHKTLYEKAEHDWKKRVEPRSRIRMTPVKALLTSLQKRKTSGTPSSQAPTPKRIRYQIRTPRKIPPPSRKTLQFATAGEGEKAKEAAPAQVFHFLGYFKITSRVLFIICSFFTRDTVDLVIFTC